jgi:hypothetical protein
MGKRREDGKKPRWCFRPIIPTLGQLRQENCEFQASLGCIVRPLSKKTQQAGHQRLTPVILAT